jgi:hypothetical protein
MNADKTMLLDVERYREILIAQRQVARNKLIQENRSSDQTNIKEP